MADYLENTAAPVDGAPDTDQPSQLSPGALMALLRTWWNLDWAHCSPWHTQARDDFAFIVGHGQWTDTEREVLDAQKRAPTVFNRTLILLKAIAGIEINSRHQIVFLPRGGTADERGKIKVKANETLSAASRWMDDTSDAEDHQSTAFQDCARCGMGWTEPIIGYDEDPKGLYYEQRILPWEMVWDYRAREKNLSDSQRRWRIKRTLKSTARAMFPGVADEDLNNPWTLDGDGKTIVDDPSRRHKDTSPNEAMEDDPQQEVTILHVQWWEYETFWLVAHPGAPNEPESLTHAQFDAFRQKIKEVEARAKESGVTFDFSYSAARSRRKVYRQAFVGGRVLPFSRQEGAASDQPVLVSEPQDPKGFTWQCITGEADDTKGHWFGLTALARDPQKFANLTLSQTSYIFNSAAKGGIIAEKDAFDDQQQAESTYARPEAITWARPGAVSKNKIMQKPGAGIAAGHVNMLEFAISSIRDCIGINLELLGLRDANQPGILEAQRKQAAMTILATLFDSLRRFRKLVGRIRLELIQRYLADGRMVLIKGDDGHELVQLMRQTAAGEYWVVVSDAPSSPNQKQETWAILRDMLPAFRDMLTPEVVMLILEYAPIPSELLDGLRKLAQKPPPPQVQAQQRLELAAGQADVQKDQASAEASRAKAVLDLAKAASESAEARYAAVQARIAELLAGQQQPRARLPDDTPFIEAPSVTISAAAPPAMQQPVDMPMAPELPVAESGRDRVI